MGFLFLHTRGFWMSRDQGGSFAILSPERLIKNSFSLLLKTKSLRLRCDARK